MGVYKFLFASLLVLGPMVVARLGEEKVSSVTTVGGRYRCCRIGW